MNTQAIAAETLGNADAVNEADATTVIGANTVLKGDLKIAGDALILGTITGNVEVAGALEVGERASIQGDIRCRSVLLAGTILGDVLATQDAQVLKSATLGGNLAATAFSIERGAKYCGNVVIGLDPKNVPKPTMAELRGLPASASRTSTLNGGAAALAAAPVFAPEVKAEFGANEAECAGVTGTMPAESKEASSVEQRASQEAKAEPQGPEIRSRASVVNGLIRRRSAIGVGQSTSG